MRLLASEANLDHAAFIFHQQPYRLPSKLPLRGEFKLVAPVQEALLVPFYQKGNAVGTIWVVTHESPNDVNSKSRPAGGQFDREDLRMLESLGRFAARAYEVWSDLLPESTGAAEATHRN